MEKPAEVLEIVFHPLSKKKDIEKCFNTNSKWRHIIENYKEDSGSLVCSMNTRENQNPVYYIVNRIPVLPCVQ